MQGGPDGSALFAGVDGVMESAEDGLEEETGDNGDADDGVVFVDLYVLRLAYRVPGPVQREP